MNPMRSLQHRQINAPNDIHFHKYLHKIEKKNTNHLGRSSLFVKKCKSPLIAFARKCI